MNLATKIQKNLAYIFLCYISWRRSQSWCQNYFIS